MDVVASTSTSNSVSAMATFPLTSYANDTTGEIKASYDSVKFDSSPSDNASVFSEVVADERDSSGMAIQVEYNPHVTTDTSNAFSQQDGSSLSSLFDVPVDQNITEAPVANINNNNNNNNNSGAVMTTVGPKRKGGWPKGKKRKRTERKSGVPKAPMTGYVRFLNSRREQVKSEYPNLSFPEITKYLGNEWSKMKLSVKQKYLDEAEADKRRYVEELKAYHQSDAYQLEAVKRSSRNAGLITNGGEINGGFGANDFEDEESDDLLCQVCNQYFSSLHNKREHMFGRQHLQNLTNANNSQLGNNGNYANTTVQSYRNASNHEIKPISTLTLLIDNMLADFYYQSQLRESEISHLRESLSVNQHLNIELQEQAEELKVLQQKLENEVVALKDYGATLNQHVDSLRLLSTLSVASNFENYTFP